MGTSIYKKYSPDHKFDGKRVLNIGCGFAPFRAPNVVNVDAFDNCSPDVVWDLNKTPLPFKDGEFDHIIANHILEHLENWWDVFNDCARLLKPNGTLEIWVPGSGSDSIRGYRDHVVEINSCGFAGTFGTYRSSTNAWYLANKKAGAHMLKCSFRRTRIVDAWWTTYAPTVVKEWMALHLRNVVIEDGYFFRKVTQAELDVEENHARARSNGSGAVPVQRVPAAGA